MGVLLLLSLAKACGGSFLDAPTAATRPVLDHLTRTPVRLDAGLSDALFYLRSGALGREPAGSGRLGPRPPGVPSVWWVLSLCRVSTCPRGEGHCSGWAALRTLLISVTTAVWARFPELKEVLLSELSPGRPCSSLSGDSSAVAS